MGAQVVKERRESIEERNLTAIRAGEESTVFSFNSLNERNDVPLNNRRGPFVIGVCAMDKKARSKPMTEILQRLPKNAFTAVMFGDDVILNQPVEDWPVCDALIAFFSTGFPLEKVGVGHVYYRYI